MKPQIICIDGNIGVGKSSIIEKLKNLGFVSFHENLEYWGSLLDMFYENPQRW
jgi:deoxyadenosine/deoxycytidine kinase